MKMVIVFKSWLVMFELGLVKGIRIRFKRFIILWIEIVFIGLLILSLLRVIMFSIIRILFRLLNKVVLRGVGVEGLVVIVIRFVSVLFNVIVRLVLLNMICVMISVVIVLLVVVVFVFINMIVIEFVFFIVVVVSIELLLKLN